MMDKAHWIIGSVESSCNATDDSSSKDMEGDTSDSCNADVWRRLLFTKGSKWADDVSDSESVADCTTLDCIIDSPCTTCVGDDSWGGIDSEVGSPEPDDLESEVNAVQTFEELRSELSHFAFRSRDLILAERFVNLLSENEMIADSVLRKGFYVAVLGVIRVLHLHDIDMVDIRSTLVHASVYLKTIVAGQRMAEDDLVYKTVLAVCLAFSYVSDTSMGIAVWKSHLGKTIGIVAKTTAVDMTRDMMDMFKSRNYMLRAPEEDARQAEYELSF
eukprot:TRINITY_DN3512_c0_g1_i2.p1 TRINITY_DN3512_c0_g1~~TRINITY_DN3512_c0_g1_i2.p1  ORF type:complete len:273 (+),score=37.86 TRINITY_DN3512_c0_g1_i2:73-891(+)